MSNYEPGSHSNKPRLSVLDLLKKYFQTRRRSDYVSDEQASTAPDLPHDESPDSGVEQRSNPREASGKPQPTIPSWCEPIDEKPRTARK
jgi:hypothetical protein